MAGGAAIFLEILQDARLDFSGRKPGLLFPRRFVSSITRHISPPSVRRANISQFRGTLPKINGKGELLLIRDAYNRAPNTVRVYFDFS